MKRIIMMVVVMALFTGCASMYSANCTRNEIATKRILTSGNTESINALRLGVPPQAALQAFRVQPLGNGEGNLQGAILGVDIANLDVFIEHPWRTIGAALLDGASAYVTYLLAEEVDDDDDDSSDSSEPTYTINITVEGECSEN